ncbi:ParB N-terminal domain-containing protein [Methylobacterium tarhaniae]|uniref:ParB/RepB/Spo0J family partition protein n=1 Tax=Methylobacterium tarhaniae TaxID=1187852 RepID=UPI003D074E8A
MSVQHETKSIPLNKLVLWDGNVRKTGAETGLDELAASIGAHGLLNPLTVGGQFRKKHYVIAGGRRLRALNALAQAGKIAKDWSVPCVMALDADHTELSLAENVVRVAMHPADQFEAWKALADQGQDAASIAVRFGTPESTVRKRLALARVSPILFEAYRQGQMGLETLQAFTVTDDHDRQEAVWTGLQGWQRDDARSIRHALTEGDVPSRDRRVRFVGLDVYEAAGGGVKRDLFDAEGGGYCTDPALLDRLTREKLEAVADEVKAEGWAWVEARLSFPWDERMTFGDAEAEGDEDEPHWSDEVKAMAGAIVTLGYDGAEIERGLIRAEDMPEPEGDDTADEGEASGDAEPASPALPASLIEDLTAHKTAALRVELARSPAVALASIVHTVALSAFYRGPARGLKGGMTIRSLERSMKGYDACPAVQALEGERERICDRLPGDPADLWGWCLSADTDTLLDVLAVAAAYGVDAVVTKTEPNRSGVAFGNALAEALHLDMAAWYTATADGYFSRLPKALILSDLEAAKGVPPAPAWVKLKKTELAALAERETASLGWLPEPLR